MAGFYCVNGQFKGSMVVTPIRVTNYVVLTFYYLSEATFEPAKDSVIFCCETFDEAVAEAKRREAIDKINICVFVIRQMTINHY